MFRLVKPHVWWFKLMVKAPCVVYPLQEHCDAPLLSSGFALQEAKGTGLIICGEGKLRGHGRHTEGLGSVASWRSMKVMDSESFPTHFNTFQHISTTSRSTYEYLSHRNLRPRRPGWCAAWRAEQKLLATETLLVKQRRAADGLAECCRFIQDHPSVM